MFHHPGAITAQVQVSSIGEMSNCGGCHSTPALEVGTPNSGLTPHPTKCVALGPVTGAQ